MPIKIEIQVNIIGQFGHGLLPIPLTNGISLVELQQQISQKIALDMKFYVLPREIVPCLRGNILTDDLIKSGQLREYATNGGTLSLQVALPSMPEAVTDYLQFVTAALKRTQCMINPDTDPELFTAAFKTLSALSAENSIRLQAVISNDAIDEDSTARANVAFKILTQRIKLANSHNTISSRPPLTHNYLRGTATTETLEEAAAARGHGEQPKKRF